MNSIYSQQKIKKKAISRSSTYRLKNYGPQHPADKIRMK